MKKKKLEAKLSETKKKLEKAKAKVTELEARLSKASKPTPAKATAKPAAKSPTRKRKVAVKKVVAAPHGSNNDRRKAHAPKTPAA